MQCPWLSSICNAILVPETVGLILQLNKIQHIPGLILFEQLQIVQCFERPTSVRLSSRRSLAGRLAQLHELKLNGLSNPDPTLTALSQLSG
jgi:hypothetical protein